MYPAVHLINKINILIYIYQHIYRYRCRRIEAIPPTTSCTRTWQACICFNSYCYMLDSSLTTSSMLILVKKIVQIPTSGQKAVLGITQRGCLSWQQRDRTPPISPRGPLRAPRWPACRQRGSSVRRRRPSEPRHRSTPGRRSGPNCELCVVTATPTWAAGV